MAFQILTRAQAYQPGSDLWVVPSDDTSLTIRKLDWYLNFQLERAATHTPAEFSSELKASVREHGIPNLAPKVEASAPLMLDARPHLPTLRLVELPESENTKAWVGKIQKIWQGLGTPTLRVFLPANLTAEEFRPLWGNKDLDLISVVPQSKA